MGANQGDEEPQQGDEQTKRDGTEHFVPEPASHACLITAIGISFPSQWLTAFEPPFVTPGTCNSERSAGASSFYAPREASEQRKVTIAFIDHQP